MGAKKDPKKDSKTPSKTPKKKEGGGGKAKKKKWSKGKSRDKLNNLVLFDKNTYDKLYKEVPSYKLITPSIVSERLKVRIETVDPVRSGISLTVDYCIGFVMSATLSTLMVAISLESAS